MHLKLSIKIKILKYGSVNNPNESNRTLTCSVNPNLLTITVLRAGRSMFEQSS